MAERIRPAGRRVPPLAAVLATFALLAVAGCGVSAQSVPQDIAKDKVPYGLLRTAPPPSASGQPNAAQVTIFLIQGKRLVGVKTTAPQPGRTDQAIRVLLGGVSTSQSDQGLRSAIPDGTHLLSFDLTGTSATLDLSKEFSAARSSDQILAVGQLVFTSTASGRVSEVSFAVNGRPIEVPGPDGSLIAGPLTRATYAALLTRS